MSSSFRKWADLELPASKPTSTPAVPASRRVLFADSRSASQESFDRLAAMFLERYRSAPSRSSQSIWQALESARADLVSRGTVSELQARRLKEGLIRDLTQMAGAMTRAHGNAEALRRAAADDGGAFASLLQVLRACGAAMGAISSESGSGAARRVGDTTCAGTLACSECGRVQRCRETTIVAPCRDCGCRTLRKTFWVAQDGPGR